MKSLKVFLIIFMIAFFPSCKEEYDNKLIVMERFSEEKDQEIVVLSLQNDSNYIKKNPVVIESTNIKNGRLSFRVNALVLAGRKYEPVVKWYSDTIVVSYRNTGPDDNEEVPDLIYPVQMKFDICNHAKLNSGSKVYFIHGNP